MKISARTMAAAEKAAARQNMSVDKWADQALAKAARGRQSDIEALLRDIAQKIDQIAERQSLGEKANEQLAAAVDEIGASFGQVRKTSGRVFEQVRSRTGSAVSDMAEKAMDVIGQVSKSATELAGSLAHKPDIADETAKETRELAKPRRQRSTKKVGARAAKKSTTTARRRKPSSKRKA